MNLACLFRKIGSLFENCYRNTNPQEKKPIGRLLFAAEWPVWIARPVFNGAE